MKNNISFPVAAPRKSAANLQHDSAIVEGPPTKIRTPQYALCIFALSSILYLASRIGCFALTPIQYNASDFTGATNNLPVTLTSLMKVQVNRQTMLVGLPITFTPTNGAYATNIYAGIYNLTIQGVPTGVTCLVPDSTNVQNLASCVISNLGLFSATNLNALITNPVTLLAGTNIQMTTNGFTVTLSGVVTNLNGLTLSNGTLFASFAGNGSQLTGLTSNQIPGLNATNITSGIFSLAQIPTNTFTATNDPRAVSLNNASNTFSGNGAGLTGISSSQLLNAGLNPLVWTNLSGQQALLVNVPQAGQNSVGDSAIILFSPTPLASSCGGWFIPMCGTNRIFNGYTGSAFSVLPNGQTNYVYDWKAVQLASTPANTVNINGGTTGFFNDPGWPFVMGGFFSGFENDWLYMDPTNWVLHFPTVNQSAIQDPRNAIGNDTLTLDQKNAIAIVSNLVAKAPNLFIANGAIGAGNVLAIGTTNTTTGERLLVQASGTSFGPGTNYAEIMIQSTSGNDGPSLRLSAHGGSDYNVVSTGSGDGTGANYLAIWSFANNQYEFLIDPSGNVIVPNGAARVTKVMSAASITSTNAPTFQATNSAPGNTTSPKLWFPVTNNGQVYLLPGYQ